MGRIRTGPGSNKHGPGLALQNKNGLKMGRALKSAPIQPDPF